MANQKLYELAGMAKNINPPTGDVQLKWKDIFPEGNFCPFQPAHTIPEKQGKNEIVMIRIYHPCFESCQLFNKEKKSCGLAG